MTNFTDQFLIAMPTIGDNRFAHSVAYMCEHNDEGAMGIVVNHPLTVTLGEVLDHMSIKTELEDVKSKEVYSGGPLDNQRGFVLHHPGGDWDSGIELDGKLQITTSRDILEAIAVGDGPNEFLVALGYAGWNPGQLEEEMAENAWLNASSDTDILFTTPAKKRWQSAAQLIGVDLNRLSSDTGHA